MKTFKLFIITILLASCSPSIEQEESQSATPSNGNIKLEQSTLDEGLVVIAELSRQSFGNSILSTGVIDVPPEYKASISSFYGGYIRSLTLLQGQYLSKGELLFEMENPMFIELQTSYLEEASLLPYLKEDFTRQQALAISQASSDKKLAKAESDYNMSKARLASLSQKLKLLGIEPSRLNSDNISSTVRVLAPISGYVSEIHANRGRYVEPKDIIVEITNTEHLHAELNIFEKDLNSLSKGQKVVFHIQGNKQKTYTGQIHLISKIIEPETRVCKVHVHIDPTDDLKQLAPGMFIEAQVLSDQHNALAIQEEAVIQQDGKYYVFKQIKDKEYRAVEVSINHRSNGWVAIEGPEEWQESDKFIVKGATHLAISSEQD